jgi:hypothetical protein
MSTATIVTAFFDINRETQGDGRKQCDYLEWIKKTLKLNCNLFIVTEAKYIDFMKQHRPEEYQTKTIYELDKLENAMYYKYLPRMSEICNSIEYKTRIMHLDRVECKLPEYNVIQYSKFGWLLDAISENPFDSKYFFWMDIGISRFFENMDLSREYPNLQSLEMLLEKGNSDSFIIQKRHDLEGFQIDDNFIWRSDNLMKGGMFGGTPNCIRKISENIEKIFKNVMLEKNNVNNEQLAITLLYKEYPEWFNLVDDNNKKACNVLEILR